MYALFSEGKLVRLFATVANVHCFASNNPAIYQQRYVSSLETLSAILAEEADRYDIVRGIVQDAELTAYNFLYHDRKEISNAY